MSIVPPEYWIVVTIAAHWVLDVSLGVSVREAWRQTGTSRRLTQRFTDFFNSLSRDD